MHSKAIAVCAALLVLLIGVAAWAERAAEVGPKRIGIHKRASVKSGELGTLVPGEKVTVKSEAAGWCQVVAKGMTGFVRCAALKNFAATKPALIPEPAAAPKPAATNTAAPKPAAFLKPATKPSGPRPYSEVTVRLYMSDWWGYCKRARALLNDLGVNLVEYDIEKDEAAAARHHELGGRGVPLVDVEGIIIRGYGEDAIRDAVAERAKSPAP